jgi:hypothetical protein
LQAPYGSLTWFPNSGTEERERQYRDDHGGAHCVWSAQLSAAISKISVGPTLAWPGALPGR